VRCFRALALVRSRVHPGQQDLHTLDGLEYSISPFTPWEKADIGFRAMSDGANEKRVDNAEFMRAVEQPSAHALTWAHEYTA
jgi:hypothetical protein